MRSSIVDEYWWCRLLFLSDIVCLDDLRHFYSANKHTTWIIRRWRAHPRDTANTLIWGALVNHILLLCFLSIASDKSKCSKTLHGRFHSLQIDLHCRSYSYAHEAQFCQLCRFTQSFIIPTNLLLSHIVISVTFGIEAKHWPWQEQMLVTLLFLSGQTCCVF